MAQKEEDIGKLCFIRGLTSLVNGWMEPKNAKISKLTSGVWDGTDAEFDSIVIEIKKACPQLLLSYSFLGAYLEEAKLTDNDLNSLDTEIYLLVSGLCSTLDEARSRVMVLQGRDTDSLERLNREAHQYVATHATEIYDSYQGEIEKNFNHFNEKYKSQDDVNNFLKEVGIDSINFDDFTIEELKKWFLNYSFKESTAILNEFKNSGLFAYRLLLTLASIQRGQAN